MELIDGKKISDTIKQEIAQEVESMVANGAKRPHLAAILVGHDGGSETYVAHKVRACEQCGFKSTLIRFEDTVTEAELLERISELNADDDVDGFIVQLPLPRHISEQKVIEAIDYRKDVDGFHPINVGRMSIGLPCFKSATPAGIMELLRRYNIPTKGANCVVLGRSNIVGKPVATLIIAAIGKPGFVTADMVKDGAVVIDVGTTRVPSTLTKSGFKLRGDVDFEAVSQKCSYITPVPGGVGPMTIVSLMQNTLLAAKKELY